MQRQSVIARCAKSRHTPRPARASPRRLGRVRMLVAELDVLVDVIADRLHQRPALRDVAELRPGRADEAVGLAVAAAEQIDQRFDGQLLQRMLDRPGRHLVRLAAVLIRKSVDSVESPAGAWTRDRCCRSRRDRRWRQSPEQDKSVGVIRSPSARWVHAEHHDHRRRLRTLIGNFVAGVNLHRATPRRAAPVFACVAATSAFSPLPSENSVTRSP